MPICKHCGVQIESDYTHCPLCGAVVDEGGSADTIDEGELEKNEAVIEAHEAKVRVLFQEVFGFVSLAGAVVVFATDFAYGMDITWSRIPLISIGYLWLSIFMIPRLKRVLPVLVLGEVLLAAVFLYALDLFTPGTSWFWGLAFPLVAAFGILMLASILIIRRFKLSVLGGLAAALISAGVFTLCIEGSLQLFFHGELRFSWSIITSASVVPLIAFLVNFDKRLKKRGSNLKKHFHV